MKIKLTVLALVATVSLLGCSTVNGMKEDMGSLKNKVFGEKTDSASTGQAAKPEQTSKAKSSTPATPSCACLAHYTAEGSFWSGRTFRSYEDFKGVNKNTAFKRIAQHLAASGWKVVNSDKDTGIISASQDVIDGKGQAVPFNVVVQDKTDGTLRVKTSFALTGGLSASKGDIQKEFCGVLEAVK